MFLQITMIGRLGKDPEMKYLPSGDPVTTFSMATDRQWNDKSGAKQKETTWMRVSVFGKQGEACNEYLSKGKMALVVGRLNVDPKTGGPRIYKNNAGEMAASFEMTADTVRFLSPKSESSHGEDEG